VGFFEEGVQLFVLYDSTFKEQLDPGDGFVRFFENAELRDKFGPRPSPTGGWIVCP